MPEVITALGENSCALSLLLLAGCAGLGMVIVALRGNAGDLIRVLADWL